MIMPPFQRIVITGPESSGKSTLATVLSEQLSVPVSREYALDFLSESGNPNYEYSDLLTIAKGQVDRESNLLKSHPLIICDTSLLVIKIWSEYRFGKVDPFVLGELNARKNELFLLCKPDLPWEAGPFRENPDDRNVLYEIYLKWLKENRCIYSIVEGFEEARFHSAIRFLNRYGLGSK